MRISSAVTRSPLRWKLELSRKSADRACSRRAMAFCATRVCKLLTSDQWISYIGVAVLVLVAADMLHASWEDMASFMGQLHGVR